MHLNFAHASTNTCAHAPTLYIYSLNALARGFLRFSLAQSVCVRVCVLHVLYITTCLFFLMLFPGLLKGGQLTLRSAKDEEKASSSSSATEKYQAWLQDKFRQYLALLSQLLVGMFPSSSSSSSSSSDLTSVEVPLPLQMAVVDTFAELARIELSSLHSAGLSSAQAHATGPFVQVGKSGFSCFCFRFSVPASYMYL